MSWLLGALAVLAAIATWLLVRGRWVVTLAPAEFQIQLNNRRERARQSRLAEQVARQFQAGQ